MTSVGDFLPFEELMSSGSCWPLICAKSRKKHSERTGERKRKRDEKGGSISILRTVGLMITSLRVVFCFSLIEIEAARDRKALNRSLVETSSAILLTYFTTLLLTFILPRNIHSFDVDCFPCLNNLILCHTHTRCRTFKK